MDPISAAKIDHTARQTERAATNKPANFQETLEGRLQQALNGMFQDAGSRYGLNPALLKAIAEAESGFDPAAVSGKGAVGLMQIMPDTARSLGIDPRDPAQSILGAAKYMRSLLDGFNGDLRLAVAAYNAGPGAVMKYNGVPPYQETMEYVNRVADLMQKYGNDGQGGIPTGNDLSNSPEAGYGESGATAASAADQMLQGSGTAATAAGASDLLQMWMQFELVFALSQLESSSSYDGGKG